MLHRTDAAGRLLVVACFFLPTLGCVAAHRGAIKSPVTPPAPLPNVKPLAMPMAPPTGDVRPASGQAPVADPPSESDPLRRLHRDATAAYDKLPCYIARLRRRESVGGRPKPEEVLIFKFRERPYSVHFKWLGDEGLGREVVYVDGQGDSKLHILTAANDIPFSPGGRRLALAPDSLMVKAASKYPITEAGIGKLIARYGRMLDAIAAGGSGITAKHLGQVQRPEFAGPLEGVECFFPANREPKIPEGGRRIIFFDPTTRFPVMALTYDTTGREVDFYCYDRFQLDVKLDDDDFNPDKLWKK